MVSITIPALYPALAWVGVLLILIAWGVIKYFIDVV